MTTNYERIKAMSVEEMAEFLSNKMDCFNCPAFESHLCNGPYSIPIAKCFLHQKQWLESEVENANRQ